MIPIIGIVGGIGSGKSLVADAFVGFGGHLIRADHLGHEALQQTDIHSKLVERWGKGILNDAGEIDRGKVGRIVFADANELRALESLVFPFIEKRILEEIARARAKSDVKFIVLDAAIMLETGWIRHCERIVFVDAPRSLRLARLKEHRGWNEDEVARREAMQLPIEEKKRCASEIIANDGQREKVVRQAQDALVRWKMI